MKKPKAMKELDKLLEGADEYYKKNKKKIDKANEEFLEKEKRDKESRARSYIVG